MFFLLRVSFSDITRFAGFCAVLLLTVLYLSPFLFTLASITIDCLFGARFDFGAIPS